MTQSMLSKNSLWCQELFQGRYLSEIAKLFLSNCRRRVGQVFIVPSLGSSRKATWRWAVDVKS